MVLRLLLDTHIVIRWLAQPGKLSREQRRVLDEATRRQECVAVSDVSFIEIALLHERERIGGKLEYIFHELDTNPMFRILPMTTEIAREVVAAGDSLRDPSDRAIVATAAVHRLRLLTSDERIIDSGLVPVIE